MNISLDIDIQELKRCKLEGDVPLFHVPCPDCHSPLPCYIDTLYYPVAGETVEIYIDCASCQKEWVGLMKLLGIKVAAEIDASDMTGHPAEDYVVK